MKGLFIGQWKLDETTVHLSHLVDASTPFTFEAAQSGVNHVPSDGGGLHQGLNVNVNSTSGSVYRRGHGSHLAPQTLTARYSFEMTLNLRSKPLGKWNRMEIQTYESVHLESGDIHPVALKHERPFWFSKVRSYT